MPRRHKVLITGSSGMLGVDLTRELRRYYELIGTDLVRLPQSRVHIFHKADITDRKSVNGIFKRIRPHIVIHTAAWTDVDGCELDRKKAYRINTDGTKNVALACKAIGAALVYISTDFVFDGRKKMPYRESDRTDPLSIYAYSKLKGEYAVMRALEKYFILRTSWLYGKYGKNFVDTIVTQARKEGFLKVVDDQVGSPTYTVDLARAIHALIEKSVACDMPHAACSGIYHVSNSGSVSWYEYAKTILKIKGVKAQMAPISSAELDRPAKRPSMSVLDNSKFKKFTGYRMRTWKNALREYLS